MVNREYHLLANATFLSTRIFIYNFYEAFILSDQEFLESFKQDGHNKSGVHLKNTPLKNSAFSDYLWAL